MFRLFLLPLFVAWGCFSLFVLFIGAITQAAHSEELSYDTGCLKHSEVAYWHLKNQGKVPLLYGITVDGKVFEVLMNSKGDWTILVTSPESRCSYRYGDGTRLTVVPAGEKS